MKKLLNNIKLLFSIIVIITLIYFSYSLINKYLNENRMLKLVIERLEAESRVAEVLVTGVNYDEKTQKTLTTIKFLEYDSKGSPLKPRFFTFTGNIIQFQSLVIRFDDIHIRNADKLKGKSAYLFWKVFLLDGENTQEFEINKINEIPDGYKIEGIINPFEERLWHDFWQYALDPNRSDQDGIKNAQIEAPGMLFMPGILYTIRLEHDGGLRIDSRLISPILRGERIPEQPIHKRSIN